MLTTQIQVLLYVGSTQVVSCSIFVPLPAIVVKSHQTLEAILPYLPLSLKASTESQECDPSSPSRPQSPALPPVPDGSSSSLVLASSPTSTSPPFPPSHHSHRHNHRRNGNSHHHHSSRDNSSTSTSNNNHKVSSNRVSPDCSIPSTTCIKISLQPTPTFKFVKPRCPHQTHRSKNLQHYLQHHQLPLPPSTSEGGEDHSHSHSHRSHRHSHHSRRNHHHHNDIDIDDHSYPHSHSHSHSQSHSHSRNHHHSTYSHSPNHPQHHHRHQPQQHQRSYSSMAAIEYPTIVQSSTPTSSSSTTSVSVLFTFPFDYNPKSTPESVQVTGSFNSWDRTPLNRNQTASRFESTVEIDLTAHADLKDNNNKVKILFKFVLDGQDWVTDAQQPLERDQQGNLNNVLILDVPVAIGTVKASSSSIPTTTTPSVKRETKAQMIARQKQEEEDDAVIRQLGGGMWGAPTFAVNDPVSLPEHFVESSSQEADNTDDKDKEAVEEKEKEQEIQETSVAASPPATETEAKKETEEERAARLKDEEDDAIIRKFGSGMWGAPMFAVNDPLDLPEHFPETVTEAASPAPEITETPSTSAPGPICLAAAPIVKPTVEEDEDDAIIRQLGGGMWGAPNFKVNDPANLPEHFVEAVIEDPEIRSSTKSIDKEKATESVAVTEKDAPAAPVTNSSSTETIVEGKVVKDEFVTSIAGTLMETVVETTEDTVIQAPDGTILEETITTDVQESVQGMLQESVTETVEIIEETEEPVPGTNDASVAVEEVAEVVMMEEEEIKIVQGEDGAATTIVEDTFTFMEGPEVDSSSLHSITTSIKPVQEGESFLVEQAPAVHVDSVEILTSASGYAKPSVDLSADVIAIPSSSVSSACSRLNGDEHEGDGDYGVVVLQGEPLTSGRQSVAGDAKPSIDMSVSTTQTIVAPSSSPASPSKSGPGLKTVKSEKRKSGLWKKIKKVLS